jgi:hypothetical protein
MTTDFPSSAGPWSLARLPLFLAALCALSTAADVARAEPLRDKAGALPTSPELERWFASAKEVEHGLRQGDVRFALEMKKAHVYAKVLLSGEVVGRFRSETSATNITGEVVSFNLARALGCGELFQPAVKVELRGKALGTFRHLVEVAIFPERKQAERLEVLAELDRSPEVLPGLYKPMTPANAFKYHGAERVDEAPNGGLETSDVVAKFLQHDAPQPGREPIELPRLHGHAPAAQLARELSDILLVDALAGQSDRFSGNNVHVRVEAERAQFMAIDNGGANLRNDQGYLEKFTHWVTRFDPTVTANLFALDAFLKKRGAFRGFMHEHALAAALGIEDADDWKAFKERVRKVTAHVRAIKGGAFFQP